VRGFGVDDPLSPTAVLSQAGLRVTYANKLSDHVEIRVRAEGLRTLSAWRVQLNESNAFVSPSFAFLLGVDVAAFFL
jgi:hypothetical protein